jgi:hypothetical protein
MTAVMGPSPPPEAAGGYFCAEAFLFSNSDLYWP